MPPTAPTVLDLRDEVLYSVLSDPSASKVAFQIGSGWEHLMLQLGLSKVVIDRTRGQSSGESIAITNLLIKWRQKEGRAATWRALFDALVGLGDRISVEFEKIKLIALNQK